MDLVCLPDCLLVQASALLRGRVHWWLSRWRCGWGDRTARTPFYRLLHLPDHLQPPLIDGIKWGKTTTTISKESLISKRISDETFAFNSRRASVLSFSSLMYSLCLWKQIARRVISAFFPYMLSTKQILSLFTEHLLLLWLWSARLLSSFEFLPMLFSFSPPSFYGNLLNNPCQGRRGLRVRNKTAVN